MHHKNALTTARIARIGIHSASQLPNPHRMAKRGETRSRRAATEWRDKKAGRGRSSTSSHLVRVVVVRLGCARPEAPLMADEMSGEVTGKSKKGS
jgi:hypothetical protein